MRNNPGKNVHSFDCINDQENSDLQDELPDDLDPNESFNEQEPSDLDPTQGCIGGGLGGAKPPLLKF